MSDTSSRLSAALAAANAGYSIERELGTGGMATVYLIRMQRTPATPSLSSGISCTLPSRRVGHAVPGLRFEAISESGDQSARQLASTTCSHSR